MHHPDFISALKAKRQFATLDRLVSDQQLDGHLKRWGGMDVAQPPHRKLTLGTALLVRRDIAAAVDEQLQCLEHYIYRQRVSSLVKQLFNDTEGLLNTWSELGLAMRLQVDGWAVEIAHVFHKDGPREKDVDVRAEREGKVRYIDVINLAPLPTEDTLSGFNPVPGSTPLSHKLINKVKEKVGSKFAVAQRDGWSGSASEPSPHMIPSAERMA